MSPSFRIGLVVLGVLSLFDVVLPLVTDGENPPMAVAVVASILGLVSISLVVSAWRGARRAIVPLVILRVLSAVSAVPALFQPGVPTTIVATAGALIVLTIVASVAVFVGSRRDLGEAR
ncbi:MAG TPA: hypothetical protein VG929_00900 [Actinomycetota bacterium]|nr:hypothetical protein [Actinomycetota bacterium]